MTEDIRISGPPHPDDLNVTHHTGVNLLIGKQHFDVWREDAAKYPYCRYVDIVIEVDGVKKEFTFEEFKQRLGFNDL